MEMHLHHGNHLLTAVITTRQVLGIREPLHNLRHMVGWRPSSLLLLLLLGLLPLSRAAAAAATATTATAASACPPHARAPGFWHALLLHDRVVGSQTKYNGGGQAVAAALEIGDTVAVGAMDATRILVTHHPPPPLLKTDDLNLDGSWKFETADKAFVGTVSVPGAWQSHGIGNETALLNNQYIGIGTYSKTVDLSSHLPPNSSLTCWLWIGGAPGGVVRSASVSANGQHVGRHVGYLQPVEMQLPCTQKLSIAVAVDSRWNVTEDPLYGSGMWDLSFGGFGGIVGHAKILFRQPVWIEDSLHVRSSPVANAAGGSWQSTFQATVLGPSAAATTGRVLHVRVCEDAPGKSCVGGGVGSARVLSVGEGTRTSLAVTVKEAQLWTPGTRAARANLYWAHFSLVGTDGATLATRSIRYGVKQMELVGNRILFNGERLFLRGYGDDGAYATTAAPPTDKTFYTRQLSDMKALGFNWVRLHTHSMPTEFFDVADELGLLCDPEFAISEY